MRKPISLLAASAMLCSLAAAAQAAEVDGPKVEWRFSTWGKPRAFTVGIETLSDIVEKRTDGNFTIRVYYGEALSKSRENLDGIKLGAFDAAHFCNFYHPGKNAAFMVFTMPFLPLGDWDVNRKVRNAVYEHPALIADMDQWGAMTYSSTFLPQYEFLGNGEPPTELSDWEGMRVRAGGGIGDAMVKLGAIKTTTTATEVYTGMQRGTMDAASFPFTYSHVAYKIHEVSDWYTTNMSPGTSDCPIVFSKKSWEALPGQYRQLLLEVKDDVDSAQIQAYIDIDKENLPMLAERLEEVTYTEEQLEGFRRAAGKPVWDAWVAENEDDFDAQGVLDLVFGTAAEAAKQ